MRIFKTHRYELDLQFKPNSWSLPLSFGGAIWADEEVGEYGHVYSCDYFWGGILGVLCFWIRLNVYLEVDSPASLAAISSIPSIPQHWTEEDSDRADHFIEEGK